MFCYSAFTRFLTRHFDPIEEITADCCQRHSHHLRRSITYHRRASDLPFHVDSSVYGLAESKLWGSETLRASSNINKHKRQLNFIRKRKCPTFKSSYTLVKQETLRSCSTDENEREERLWRSRKWSQSFLSFWLAIWDVRMLICSWFEFHFTLRLVTWFAHGRSA